MSKTIVICGYGSGVSHAVAERFGKEGFDLALAARSADRLKAAEQAFAARNLRAVGFPTDLTSPEETQALIAHVRDRLGPITAIHWNAYASAAGDLTQADIASVRAQLDIAVTSPIAALQAALPDLRAARGAFLVTNGGLANLDPATDAVAVQWGSMGLAVANAAKHKLIRLLAEKLRPDGVYAGEVMINGLVKGTAFDNGNANVAPEDVAAAFWDLYSRRAESSVSIG
jgi:NAD(P)-dependent dehydrogenase (short-subunit alcohol dehydrogenase family)